MIEGINTTCVHVVRLRAVPSSSEVLQELTIHLLVNRFDW